MGLGVVPELDLSNTTYLDKLQAGRSPRWRCATHWLVFSASGCLKPAGSRFFPAIRGSALNKLA